MVREQDTVTEIWLILLIILLAFLFFLNGSR